MSLYRVMWTESYQREVTADIDEETMRDSLDVPIGPISLNALIEYLEEDYGDGLEFHPGGAPDAYNSEFAGLDIDDITAPTGGAS